MFSLLTGLLSRYWLTGTWPLFALQVFKSFRMQASLYRALKRALRVMRHSHEPAGRRLDLGERSV